jgi:hypothetical protein
MLILLPNNPEYRCTLEAILPKPSLEMAMKEGFVDRIREHYANFDADEWQRKYKLKLTLDQIEHISRMKNLIRSQYPSSRTES